MHPFYRQQMLNKLHPGETPLEYRERIGHVSNDPKTWGPLDGNPDAHPEGVFVSHDCGCRVVGNGTLPYPLTILFCEDHAPPDPREVRYTVVLHIDIAGKRCDLTVGGQFTDAAFAMALAFRLGHATIFYNATPMATAQSYVISLTDDATEEIVRASVAL